MKQHFLFVIKEYLESTLSDFSVETADMSFLPIKALEDRKNGKVFDTSDHIRGLIYAQLSNQAKWKNIAPHLDEIDNIFYQYDIEKIRQNPGSYYNQRVQEIRCGNRGFSRAMDGLNDNLDTFMKIADKYGSLDEYVTSIPSYMIAKELSEVKSEYKLKMVGEALAWEYLRNVGIDGAKPDAHLCRFLGADRMGTGKNGTATAEEVYNQAKKLSDDTGLSMTAVDAIIWNYCADGYGEICTASPHCEKCVVREFCAFK